MKPRKNRRVPFASWVVAARTVHGDKYEYDESSFIMATSKLRIKCPYHGWFEQRANAHTLQNAGCLECSGRNKMTLASFIAASKNVHGSAYDYSQSIAYENQNTIMAIICKEHGVFYKRAAKHLHGQGCPKCAVKNRAKNAAMDIKDFIAKAVAIHGDAYSYIGTYTTTHEKMTVTHNICGTEFFVRPSKHLFEKTGCPKCSHQLSHGETELFRFIASHASDALSRDRTTIPPFELDILVPSKNLGFEFNGIFWHSDAWPNAVNRHKQKSDLATINGIRVLHIFEDEWAFKQNAVKSLVLNALGKSPGLRGARELSIKVTAVADVCSFLENNHVQGTPQRGTAYSLINGDAVVATMVFSVVSSERGKSDCGWELTRFASAYNIPGAASRLFTAFVRSISPSRVISFSENRLFTGGMYSLLGFTATHITRPSYWVVVDGVRQHKAGFKKSRLKTKIPGYTGDTTEKAACHQMGWHRIYDCGLTKWVWLPPK